MNIRQNAIDVVKQMVADGQISQEIAEKYFPELKSEDEKYKEWILKYLYYGLGKSDEQFKDQFETAINWLESLKPQTHWKPSDEQIEILNMVLTNESMDDNIARILRELREQLKKLMKM